METVKIQVTGLPRSPWTRPSAPGRGYTSKALASVLACTRSRVGTKQTWLVAIDWVTGRSYSPSLEDKTRDGSKYSQAYVRTASSKERVRAWPPVIVDTEKVLREAGGSVG